MFRIVYFLQCISQNILCGMKFNQEMTEMCTAMKTIPLRKHGLIPSLPLTHTHTHKHILVHIHIFTHFGLFPHSVVILFITAIVLFPAGMGSNNVKVLCGSSAAPYHLGKCSIGWSYILVIVGTGVGVAAAAMSWTTYKWREKSHIQTYNV